VAASSTLEDRLLEKMSTGPVVPWVSISMSNKQSESGARQNARSLIVADDALAELSEDKRSLCRPVLDGSDVQRYEISWPGLYLTYDTKQLYNPKSRDLLDKSRFSSNALLTACDGVRDGHSRQPAYPLNTIYILDPREDSPFDERVVSVLLNSACSDWWYRTKYQAICVRGGYVEFRREFEVRALTHRLCAVRVPVEACQFDSRFR